MAAWMEKFSVVTNKTHTEQGIWYLNGFWEDGAKEQAEQVWTMVHQFIEVDLDRPKRYGKKEDVFEEGTALDEFKSHRILEVMGETLTVVALRKRLKALDLDSNKKMAITEFMVDKFSKLPEDIATAPQGDVDPDVLADAQEACASASAALGKASEDAEAAAKALEDSTAAAANAATAKTAAETALAAAEVAETEVKAAEAENEAALKEIEAQEQAKTDLITKCQGIIDDPAMGTVKKGKAKQDMEATKSEDPLPLNRARITQKAALKKVTKARKKAETATEAAKEAAKDAAKAKEEADAAAIVAAESKVTADAAAEAAAVADKAALDKLDALKSKGGSPQGKLWWMERVLTEKRKFMRTKK